MIRLILGESTIRQNISWHRLELARSKAAVRAVPFDAATFDTYRNLGTETERCQGIYIRGLYARARRGNAVCENCSLSTKFPFRGVLF